MKKITFIVLAVFSLIFVSGCESQNQSQPPQNTQNANGSHADSSYNLDSLIEAVKKAGAISGNPQNLDTKDNDATKVIAYGNVVFLEFDPSSSQGYFTAYDAGELKIQGKTVKIGAINGPYMMAFLDNKVDQKAVKAFRSIGYAN